MDILMQDAKHEIVQLLWYFSDRHTLRFAVAVSVACVTRGCPIFRDVDLNTEIGDVKRGFVWHSAPRKCFGVNTEVSIARYLDFS